MEERAVLVTGSCGFIGSHFVRHLLRERPWRVVSLDKLTYAGDLARLSDVSQDPRHRFVQGDVGDPELVGELLRAEGPWAIVNFAAESHVDRSILDPAPFLQTNIQGAYTLLEAARRHGVERFLQVSTDEVYGDVEGLPPRGENDPLRPSSPYAASKASADLLCIAYWRTYRLPVLIARSSNNYGPYQHPEKLIPLAIRNLLRGDSVPVYGDGRQVRDWLFVEDNCRALLEILERGQAGGIYNVATGVRTANFELLRRICEILAEELRSDLESYLSRIELVADRPGHDREYAVSIDRITEELGWKPLVDLQEGLRRTVRWFLENRGWLERAADSAYHAYYEAVYARRWGMSWPA